MVYDFVREHVPLDAIRAAGEFGPEIAVVATAPVGERLLALVGRQPLLPARRR